MMAKINNRRRDTGPITIHHQETSAPQSKKTAPLNGSDEKQIVTIERSYHARRLQRREN